MIPKLTIVPVKTSTGCGEEPASEILKTGTAGDKKYYTLTSAGQVYTYYPGTDDFRYGYEGQKRPQKYTKEEFIKLIAAAEEKGQVVEGKAVQSSQVGRNNDEQSRANLGRVFTNNSYNRGSTRNCGAANDRLSAEITQAKITCLTHDLRHGVIDLTTFDKLIADLPDRPIIVPTEQAALHAKPKMPKLAALLLTCCDGINIGADIKQSDGSLTVLEGIKCLYDQVRTKRFLESVAISVDKLTQTKDRVHVVDAGCGAVPIFSIYAAMRSDKVHVTAIELNPNSFQIAQGLIKKLGLQDRITLIQGDATSYQPTEPIDLLVSETMHSGLTQEKIVPIMHNLVPRLNDDGIVLPEAVTVKVGLAPIQTYAETNEKIR
jgi:tRNA A58 N-methylase Trm61